MVCQGRQVNLNFHNAKGGGIMSVYLINDAEKFMGQYVATKGFSDKKVICHGEFLQTVMEETIEMGIKEPAIYYIPKEGVQIL